jgi:hypothetical protein
MENWRRQSNGSSKSRPTLSEAFVFKLGKDLGGAKEVLHGSASSMLMYMDMALKRDEDEPEKKKAEHFINYLIAMYTQPSFGKTDQQFESSKKKFVESITPKLENAEPAKEQEWDADHMKYVQQKLNQ